MGSLRRPIRRNRYNFGSFGDPGQFQLMVNQIKKLTGQVKDISQVSGAVDKDGETLLSVIKKSNELINKIYSNSELFHRLNTITSNITTLSIAATTTPQIAYHASEDRVAIFSRPGLAGEGADIIYIGNEGLNTTTGYPIISGVDFGPIILKRDTKIWVVSSGTATLHILLF